MKRQFYSCETFPVHVGGKSINKMWPLSLDDAWVIFTETIAELQEEYPLQTHAFVLMSNHYHWLCTYENINQDKLLLFEWFHELVSYKFFHKSMEAQLEPCFQTFDKPAKVITIDHIKAYQTTYRYIYRNPIEAGMVSVAEDYPYSTLSKILKGEALPFDCVDGMNAIYHPPAILGFINQVIH